MLREIIKFLIQTIFKTKPATVLTVDSEVTVTGTTASATEPVFTLIRTSLAADGIFGTLDKADGENIAVTLEHSYNGRPKLPPGSYTCVKGLHKLHDGISFETFEITGVPGHTGVLFHVGNYNKDSNGCVLLGRRVVPQETGERMITSSKNTFNKFIDITKNIDSFVLKVI